MGSPGQASPSVIIRLRRREPSKPTVRLVRRQWITWTDGVPPNAASLSLVEYNILWWLSNGKTYEDISAILEIKTNAVYQHAHRMMDKLNAATAAGAVAIALRRGLFK